MANYDLGHLGYKDKLKTNAAQYYRIMVLKNNDLVKRNFEW
jgi:hypothetical protein